MSKTNQTLTLSQEQLAAITQAVALALASEQEKKPVKTRAKKAPEKVEIIEDYPLPVKNKPMKQHLIALAIIQKNKVERTPEIELIYHDLIELNRDLQTKNYSSEQQKVVYKQLDLICDTLKTFIENETLSKIAKEFYFSSKMKASFSYINDVLNYRASLINAVKGSK